MKLESETRREHNIMLRMPQLVQLLGICRSSIYTQIEQGLLTKQISVGARAIALPRFEVLKIMESRMRGDSEDEIRELVNQLHSNRSQIVLR